MRIAPPKNSKPSRARFSRGWTLAAIVAVAMVAVPAAYAFTHKPVRELKIGDAARVTFVLEEDVCPGLYSAPVFDGRWVLERADAETKAGAPLFGTLRVSEVDPIVSNAGRGVFLVTDGTAYRAHWTPTNGNCRP